MKDVAQSILVGWFEVSLHILRVVVQQGARRMDAPLQKQVYDQLVELLVQVICLHVLLGFFVRKNP